MRISSGSKYFKDMQGGLESFPFIWGCLFRDGASQHGFPSGVAFGFP